MVLLVPMNPVIVTPPFSSSYFHSPSVAAEALLKQKTDVRDSSITRASRKLPAFCDVFKTMIKTSCKIAWVLALDTIYYIMFSAFFQGFFMVYSLYNH